MYQSLSKGLSIPTFNSNVSISEYRITILLAEQVYQYIIIMSQENVSVAKAMLTIHYDTEIKSPLDNQSIVNFI